MTECISPLLPARLQLEDGREFCGYSFGCAISTSGRTTTTTVVRCGLLLGEVVFNSGMVGYPEALTDPSYAGQILTLTFPLVGNYGVPGNDRDENGLLKYFEGERIFVKGLIVADYSFTPSHYTSRKSLASWLIENRIPGIGGIDTRALTKHLRTNGSALGRILIDNSVPAPLEDPNLRNLVDEVSCKTIRIFTSQNCFLKKRPDKVHRILVVDCGLKLNILRSFLSQTDVAIEVTVVPWNDPFGDRDPESYDGLFLSNGPGNPEHCQITIENIRKVMRLSKPIFGICLGNQLLALAAGGKTYKMKFGNRGMNQPVIDLRTTRCYITPQNHGYAVDSNTLPAGWIEVFINANDKTNEGITHTSMPWLSVQFHPEASGGPTDSWFLFQQFLYQVQSQNRSPPVVTIPVSFPCQRIRVLLLGSGGLSIGQAGEFDYSGSQAIKALKESNLEVILINPNIATVQTSSHLADRIYFLPIVPSFVEKVIHRERPSGILCGFAGQTGLNCAVELYKKGILAKYKCEVLGTPIQSIIATEDREIFVKELLKIDEKCAPSVSASNLEGCLAAAEQLGYPLLLRSAFSLGGLGSGFAADEDSLLSLCKDALAHSKQVVLDKSLRGWKEIEYEVVRDWKDNCVTVCNMENFDPLGIHTGDSIVVAPSQTLTNTEYYRLREVALKVIRHFRIVGECNIQFAVDPDSDAYFIVEVNARLSRSSALASKATGYPLAYVATKLALGINLLQIKNAVTRTTSACFEPALDYVVTKVPRWDLAKFAYVDQTMGSSMKSVGEIMAIGRTFEESLQKALRTIDDSACGFDSAKYEEVSLEILKDELMKPSPARIWAIARAFQCDMSVDEIFELTRIDKWFLSKLYRIHLLEKSLSPLTLEQIQCKEMKVLKSAGFSDRHIASKLKTPCTFDDIRKHRMHLNVRPCVKQIDTLAAEFPATTNYLYLTYQGIENDVLPLSKSSCETPLDSPREIESSDHMNVFLSQKISPVSTPRQPSFNAYVDDSNAESIVVLGCGCYRIGSSVEFDWSAMSCVRTLRSLGHKAIVINCNPETVSTDYDESDRLFFEVLDLETVLDIWEFESPKGVVVSVGGQTPNNLSIGGSCISLNLKLSSRDDCSSIKTDLDRHGVHILGTSAHSIDQAEDRYKFSQLCDSLNIDQPAWSAFTSLNSASQFAISVGFPVLVRPSYVLSGAAMRVVTKQAELKEFLVDAALVSPDHPVVISKYIDGAKEVEVDAVATNGEILNYAISEHVENAGVHSGDATLILPAQKLYVETIRQVRKISQKVAAALSISGPFNIQFMCKKNQVQVIECNLRASRTFPFISKIFNIDFIELATRVMVNAPVRSVPIQLTDLDFVGVKTPVFSFNRLRKADPMLGVEMRSTGEVACFGTSKYEAFLKSMLASAFKLPHKAILLSVGTFNSKVEFLSDAGTLSELGYRLYATSGTYNFFNGYNRLCRNDDQESDNNNFTLWRTCSPTVEDSNKGEKENIGKREYKSPPDESAPSTPCLRNHSRCLSPQVVERNVEMSTGTMLTTPPSECYKNVFNGKLFEAYKPERGIYPDVVSLIEHGEVDLVINLSGSLSNRSSASAGYQMRTAAINCGVPLITDLKVAQLFVESLRRYKEAEKNGRPFWEIKCWDEYINSL